MTAQNSGANPPDLNPEAVLARAAKARGDVFPEWKPVAYAIPRTYHLINETGSYLHQYHGQEGGADKLSAQMRELIAIPALCAKGDMRHTYADTTLAKADLGFQPSYDLERGLAAEYSWLTGIL